jgi:hypothetical protein
VDIEILDSDELRAHVAALAARYARPAGPPLMATTSPKLS